MWEAAERGLRALLCFALLCRAEEGEQAADVPQAVQDPEEGEAGPGGAAVREAARCRSGSADNPVCALRSGSITARYGGRRRNAAARSHARTPACPERRRSRRLC